MIDFEKMSDEDIDAMYTKEVGPIETDFDSMSDEDIDAMYNSLQNSDPADTLGGMEKMSKQDPFGDREPSLAPDPVSMGEYYDETIVPAAEDIQTGIAATAQGGYVKGLDWAERLGFDVKDLKAEEEQVLKILNDDFNNKSGDIFTAGNLGRMLPSLATLPIAYQSKLAAFLVEGGIGAAEARGEGLDEYMSDLMGLFVGGATAGTMGLIDYLTRDKADMVFDYVKKMNNITDDEAEIIFTKWSKIMNAEDNFANRTKAIVDSLGDKGANMKVEAAAGDPMATQQIEASIKERRGAVESLFEGADNVQYTADAVEEASGVIKDNYKRVKEHISDKPSDLHLDIPDALDEATMGDAKAVKEIFDNPSLSVKDLIDAMPHVNSLLRRTKGVTKHQWSVIKDRIDGSLKNNLSNADYSLWKNANDDYAKMAKVTNHKIGATMDLVRSGDMTPEEAIKKIKTMSGGKALFQDLQFMIGSEKTAAFEKAILKEAMGKNSEFVDWAHLARNMDSKGFTTETGKNMKKVIDDMAESFVTDDAIQEIYFRDKGLVAGMSDDIMAKIRYSLVGKAFTSLVKRVPFNETSKHMLRMDQLAEILKNPTQVKNLMEELNNIAPGVKEQFIKETIQEAQKQIPYKPGAAITGDVNANKLYASKSGTVADSPTTVTLSESQRELVQESLGSNVATDKVMHIVDKMMKGKRAESIVNSVAARMKADDAIGNQNMLRKIVQEESNYIVKAIEKDMGIKLPQSEAEKIYKMKIAKMLEECK